MAVTIKTTEELVAEVKYEFVQNLEGFNDTNVGSVLDLFTTAVCERINEYYGDLSVVQENAYVETAEGIYLDYLGEGTGIPRKAGDNSTGLISFKRKSPATSEFIIPANSQTSTQPASNETQYIFSTIEAATFIPEISEETQEFIDGFYDYKLGARFVTEVENVNGTSSSASQIYVEGTDYSIVNDSAVIIFDTSEYTLADNCEVTTGWTAEDCTTSISTTRIQGVNSITFLKSSTIVDTFGANKTLSSTLDFSQYGTFVYLNIKDQTALDKIEKVNIYLGNLGGIINAMMYTIYNSKLEIGWNLLELTDGTTIGNPDIGTIDHIKMNIVSNNVSDLFATDDLNMDFWFNCKYETYDGDIIRWDITGTLPDTGTDFEYDYKPLSIDILSEALEVGEGYNVQSETVIYKISNLVNIDSVSNHVTLTGGIDVETDDIFRERIQEGSAINDVSTVSAIKANVESLTFVRSAEIEDLPLEHIDSEGTVFDSGQDEYTLSQFVALDNANLTVGDTGGASDYTKDVDFQLNDNNQIEWLGVSEPTHGNTFYTDYDINKLGYYKLIITGVSGSLNSSQTAEVEALLATVNSAGVKYEITEPTEITATVVLTTSIETGYDTTTVKTNVNTAIENYIFSLGINEDVLLAQIISVSMAVDGVENISSLTINAAGADLAIGQYEVAKNGTHTIN